MHGGPGILGVYGFWVRGLGYMDGLELGFGV